MSKNLRKLGTGGTNTERAEITYLLSIGYKLAQRTAGSHSAIDIVAINQDNQYEGFQIKRAKRHKYVSSRLSEARSEVGSLPIKIRIYCCEHRKWYEY
jgi:hypothetical protein